MVTIRAERPEDYEAVHEVNRRAFGRENEARLVEQIRQAEGFIPELSLVAEEDGRVLGHILFSPIRIEGEAGDAPALALAPVAVLPEYQKRGVGSALVRQGLEACREAGHGAVIVVGHAEYYPRFGFTPARALGIEAPFKVRDENWMAIELRPGALEGVSGVVRYPQAFEDV